MIDHVWTVVCRGSSIDGENNTISLFNVLEQLTIGKTSAAPVQIPIELEIISLWIRKEINTPALGKMRTFFCDPDNSRKKHAEIMVNLSQSVVARTRIRSVGLEIKGPGKYKFVVEYQNQGEPDWRTVASIPILVALKPAPSGAKNN